MNLSVFSMLKSQNVNFCLVPLAPKEVHMRAIKFVKRHAIYSAIVMALIPVASQAADPSFVTGQLFDLTVNVGGTYNPSTDSITGSGLTGTRGFGTATQLFDLSKDSGFNQINSAYSGTSAAVIRLGYRGLPLVLQTSANSATVSLYIPSLGVQQSFNSKSTRDDNLSDAKDFLKKSGGDILNRMQQVLAKVSPVDPVAGNPASMQSRAVADDFDRNYIGSASNIKASADSGGGATNNLIGTGLSFGNYSQGGFNTQVVTLPLSYTFRSDLDPRRQLSFYAPITVTSTSGSKSVGVNAGVSYRIPMSDEWALTPAFGYGVNGSADMGSVAAMIGTSITSMYVKRFDSFDLAMGNMIGYYQTSKFSAGGYSFDPQIKNTVYRNGLMASVPTSFLGQRMAAEYSFINTIYTGTDLYSKQYNEIGASIGTNKSANSSRSYLRGGISLLQGQNGIKGYKFNFGYWF
jgi:hypothetical protein